MTDDHNSNVREIPPRPPAPTPANTDAYMVRAGQQSSAEHDAKQVALTIQQRRLTEWRTAARQDALIIVEKARERAGFSRTGWTPLEADTLHMITDLLLQVQVQEAPRA